MELLSLAGIEKRYRRAGREVRALDGVSLDLYPGDFVGVLGDTRAGKTTLLRIAAGIESPDGGSVRFMGRDVAELSRRDRETMLRSEIGCVWKGQRSLRPLAVVSHVAFPLISARWRPDRARGRAHELLRRVAADHCADALLPELSASELVRVSLAQALIREPRLLLADEPAETLNSRERGEITGIVRSLASDVGVTVLMTAGDASGTMRATRLASLSEGRLLATRSGEPGEVVDLSSRERRRGGASG